MMDAETVSRRGSDSSRVILLLKIADKYLIWVLFFLSYFSMAIIQENVFSVKFILSLGLNASVLGIMVIAASLPFLIGKFDLSIESTLAFSALIGGIMVKGNVHFLIAIMAVLLIGVAIGAVNGVFIMYLGVNPFVQTLSMNIIFRGMIFLISGGIPFYYFPKNYRFIGATKLGGVPVPIIVLILFYLFFIVILERTRWGRKLYAVGQNSNAAFASGININIINVQVFILAGLLAAFSGLILSTRLNSIDYNVGRGMVFEVFAAAVIGGVSLKGGRGSLFGAIGGVLFLSVISSILTWLDIDIYWVETTRGFIILFAIFMDAFKNKIRENIRRR